MKELLPWFVLLIFITCSGDLLSCKHVWSTLTLSEITYMLDSWGCNVCRQLILCTRLPYAVLGCHTLSETNFRCFILSMFSPRGVVAGWPRENRTVLKFGASSQNVPSEIPCTGLRIYINLLQEVLAKASKILPLCLSLLSNSQGI